MFPILPLKGDMSMPYLQLLAAPKWTKKSVIAGFMLGKEERYGWIEVTKQLRLQNNRV